MGDTKRTRERKGEGKRAARRELEVERELSADTEPPVTEADADLPEGGD